MNHFNFFKNFLTDKNIGAFFPSSLFSINRICKKIDFNKKIIIVEYGPGPGVISKKILNKMTGDSKLILIETNPVFYDYLCAINDPRLFIFNKSAADINNIIEECNETSVDYIISGIPFSFFPDIKKMDIISKSHLTLATGGKFIVYQYTFKMKKYLKHYFDTLTCEIELLNFLPIFIMAGEKSFEKNKPGQAAGS